MDSFFKLAAAGPMFFVSPKFPPVIRVHGRLPGVSGWRGRDC
jgi:hypothetical protein